MERLVSKIEEVLWAAPSALTVTEISDRVGVTPHDIDRVIWGEPDRFVWQPGHRWSLGIEKPRPTGTPLSVPLQEAREGPLSRRGSVQLRATTLASGVTIRVSRRSLDSHAVFTVKSAGNIIDLVLNSSHELFAEMPMPFVAASKGDSHQKVVETLLHAWALYEDSVPGGPTRRAAEDIRLLWGRRVLEVLRDSDASG